MLQPLCVARDDGTQQVLGGFYPSGFSSQINRLICRVTCWQQQEPAGEPAAHYPIAAPDPSATREHEIKLLVQDSSY